MTLLTIAQGVAKEVGIAVPTQVVGSSDRSMVEMLSLANETGEELARRVDWGQLTASATLTGDGTQLAHSMPSGFSRLTQGIAVVTATGTYARPLMQAEWAALTAVEGVPRYFILRDNVIRLWPHLANAVTATANYQTGFWCSNGTAGFTADDETSLINEDLFRKALEVRWRRQKGMPYADQEAEFEAALADLAQFNGRARF